MQVFPLGRYKEIKAVRLAPDKPKDVASMAERPDDWELIAFGGDAETPVVLIGRMYDPDAGMNLHFSDPQR